jgi:hypothetical protein
MGENINENKALSQTNIKCRFFAQYWGTKTMYVGGVGLVEIGTSGWNLKHPDFFLELKPLSKISNEDAIEVAKIVSKSSCGYFEDVNWQVDRNNAKDSQVWVHNGEDPLIICYINFTGNIFFKTNGGMTRLHINELSAYDFLRSKGYALPFMEYSIDELIEFGWVRLV